MRACFSSCSSSNIIVKCILCIAWCLAFSTKTFKLAPRKCGDDLEILTGSKLASSFIPRVGTERMCFLAFSFRTCKGM
ncbi:hypothetical protein HanPI659440_Chr11g0403291 [Helianthus annuus]|nr:hypothetical protein HanPI659440_Chr11g0403291 [Helianthus annuus]